MSYFDAISKKIESATDIKEDFIRSNCYYTIGDLFFKSKKNFYEKTIPSTVAYKGVLIPITPVEADDLFKIVSAKYKKLQEDKEQAILQELLDENATIA